MDTQYLSSNLGPFHLIIRWACEKCDGLGVEHFFSPDLVIKNEDLSISEGAIRGWDRRNFYYFHLIKNLSKHYDFDIDVPYKNINEEIKEILLNGSGDEKIAFVYPGRGGKGSEEIMPSKELFQIFKEDI